MAEVESSPIAQRYVVVQSQQPPGFEGQIWVDTSSGNTTYQYKNGSWEEISLDGDIFKERDLELIADIAEARYGASVGQENYDDVFYDVFVDQSKISSSNNAGITTGTNGQIDLTAAGNGVTRPSDDNTLNNNSDYGIRINPNEDLTQLDIRISGNASGFSTMYVEDESGTQSIDVTSKSAGDTVSVTGSWSSGTKYAIYFNESMTHGYYGSPSWPYNGDKVDIVIGHQNGGDYSGRAYNFDKVTGYSRSSSGSITSTQKSLGFTPSNLIIQQDADIPADEDITYDINDNSGNTVTVTQSEVGSEIDASSLADGDITVDVNLSSSDGNDQPTLYEYGVMFV